MSAPLWTLAEAASAMGAAPRGPIAAAINGVSIDTRSLSPGDLFFAIKGENRDGHDFVDQAMQKGATAVVSIARSFDMPQTHGLLVVEDPFEALRRLGRAGRARTAARVVAVTGSVGKTGTKEALRHVLAGQGRTHAAVASYNNHWGVPLTLARMPKDTVFGVAEIGMNAPGEIRPLSAMVRPQAAIITTVEPVHLEFFPSVEAIADAKAEIFSGIEPGGTAIVNIDNPHAARLSAHALASPAGRVVSFGATERANLRLVSLEEDENGSAAIIEVFGRPIACRIGMPGRHIAINMLSVLAAVHALGADVEAAAAALATLNPPQGRGARIELHPPGGAATLIDESYNANPASMRAMLSNLARLAPGAGGRRVVVLGDMRELGENGPRFHAELATAIEQSGIDLVHASGPLMRHLYEALPSSRRGHYAASSAELEPAVVEEIRAGDVVAVKGSLGSRMGRIVQALRTRHGAPATGSAPKDDSRPPC
ncbi:UDP-N-acetylmuramoyl-tripeptide--D-alanyl-D-alanine ligase [Rhizobiales bacterium GAS191]|nr:UDP-N-acetylmuramoyl-tripeptide--D-alanyl-D-alanine ligase [Rhizobiales bacterium GAS113]SEE94248.1 UDP-N-acetylmuramoyl-tripeptide--D-alanyl-D-alanine ligase [Rhizobiales bacterium GAS191]